MCNFIARSYWSFISSAVRITAKNWLHRLPGRPDQSEHSIDRRSRSDPDIDQNLPEASLSLTVLFLDLFADIFANKTDRRFFEAVFEFSSWSTSSKATHKIMPPSDWLKLTKIIVICGACTVRQKWFPFSVARTWNYKRIEFSIVFIHSKINYGL